MIVTILALVAVIVMVLAALRLLRPLPDRAAITTGTALPPARHGLLAGRVEAEARNHPGQSGVVAIAEGNDALSSRIALARLATTSLDVQYYIWHDDLSGRVLLGELHDAAQRGVRVRLLLDDNGIDRLDPTIMALDALPNAEVRLFNPSTTRQPKILGFAYDFFRMNRRMHNKSFTVDGVASIVGGRNIGDEYFRIGSDTFFLDLDVLAFGPVVLETSAMFDRYWNSASVYPAGLIVPAGRADLDGFLNRVEQARRNPAFEALVSRREASAQALMDGKADVEWTEVTLLADDPAKGLGQARGSELLIAQLGRIMAASRRKIDLISAYLVPGPEGCALFTGLARDGTATRILTNAFATTDVKAVHSGYIKYRKALLKAGVRLLELRPGRQQSAAGKPQHSLAGSSSASLHAKTVAMDDERIFIGSFNFDPRSARLNCEMGYLIASPALASAMHEAFDRRLGVISHEPVLDKDGQIAWKDTAADGTVLLSRPEPGTTRLDRMLMWLMGKFPIERWL